MKLGEPVPDVVKSAFWKAIVAFLGSKTTRCAMQVSAEVRWFGMGPVPADLKQWFHEPARDFRHPIGGGRPRTDVYLLLHETELGIKRRGGKKGLEVKGLLDVLPGQLELGQVSVSPQLFCKWGSAELELASLPTVETVKTRWLRKFDTATAEPREIQLGAGEFGEDPLAKDDRPDVGCNVELTSVTKAGETWWTFGAESFAFGQPGQTVALVGQGLLRTMQMLASHAKIDLRGARYLGYPEWIAGGG